MVHHDAKVPAGRILAVVIGPPSGLHDGQPPRHARAFIDGETDRDARVGSLITRHKACVPAVGPAFDRQAPILLGPDAGRRLEADRRIHRLSRSPLLQRHRGPIGPTRRRTRDNDHQRYDVFQVAHGVSPNSAMRMSTGILGENSTLEML